MEDIRLFAGLPLPLLVLVAVAALEAAWLARRGVAGGRALLRAALRGVGGAFHVR